MMGSDYLNITEVSEYYPRVLEREFNLFNTNYLKEGMILKSKRSGKKWKIHNFEGKVIILDDESHTKYSKIYVDKKNIVSDFTLVKFINKEKLKTRQIIMITSINDLEPIMNKDKRIFDPMIHKYVIDEDNNIYRIESRRINSKTLEDLDAFILMDESNNLIDLEYEDILQKYQLIDVSFEHII